MKLTPTGLNGLLLIELDFYSDSRGYFTETFNQEAFRKAGIDFTPVQDNESGSVKGVIRGLHYQLRPFDQAKLIRAIEGNVFDVALDLRRSSPTFGKWFGTELNSETKKMLFIPKGFAHGFSVLSDTAIVQYKCDNFYNPSMERGINPGDPALGIDWKLRIGEAIISDKDLKNPCLINADFNF